MKTQHAISQFVFVMFLVISIYFLNHGSRFIRSHNLRPSVPHTHHNVCIRIQKTLLDNNGREGVWVGMALEVVYFLGNG